MKKKWLAGLMATVLWVSMLFSGCGTSVPVPTASVGAESTAAAAGAESTTATASVESSTATAAPEANKNKLDVLKVTVDGNLINFPEGLDANKNFIIDGLRKKFGIDIQWTILPLDGNLAKLNAMMSAGDAGDIVSMRDSSLIGRYAKEKLIVALDDYLPSTINLNDAKTPDAIKLLTTVDGKRYAVSTVNGLPGTTATLVRKDWLVKLGLNQPKDKDDLMSILQKLRDGDPDGNGKDDTIPLVTCGSAVLSQSFFMVRGLFDIPNDYQEKNGNIVFTLIEPEGKQFLEYAAKLYSEKLIPQDYSALKDQAAWDLVMGDKGAMFTDWPWAARTNIPAIKEKYNGDLKFMDNPKSISGITAQSQTQTPLAMSVMVTKFCKDPQTAVNFLDMLLTDEMITLTNYGIEGETFTIIDGKPVFTEDVKSGKNDLTWNIYYANHVLQTPEIWHYKDATLGGWGEYYYATERNVGKIYPADVMMPPQADLITARTDLATSVVQFYDDVVTGKASIDGFDKFRETWLADGGQAIVDGYTKLYKDMGSPKFSHPQANIVREGFTGVNLYNGKP